MALATSRGNVKIEGLDRVLRDLRTVDPIYALPWKRAMTRATNVGRRAVESRAPRATGELAGNITTRLDSRTVPLYGIVSTTAASEGGFRYPFALEAGKGRKTREGANSVTHYRSGPRQGRLTRRWFRGSLATVRKEINALLTTAAREVESRWGR